MNHDSRLIRRLEEELNIRFGHAPRKSTSSSISLDIKLRRLGALRRQGLAVGSHDADHAPGLDWGRQQRVIIKASYTVHRGGQRIHLLREHVRYLARESASLDGQLGRFYNDRENDLDAARLAQKWEQDRHHFRLIISPEYADRIDQHPNGLTGYIRELVAQMQQDLNTKLEWMAINHFNTDDRHAHLLLRGKRFNGHRVGKDLVIPRRYMSHGMRQAAQKIATRWLGERISAQVHDALKKEVTAERYTSLDAALECSLIAKQQVQLRRIQGLQVSKDKRPYVIARLQHLKQMGLASKGRGGRWRLDPDLRRTLQSLGEHHDVIKYLYAKLGKRSAQVATYDPSRNREAIAGRVLTTGVHDELRDQQYVLIQDAKNQMHYARVANRESLAILQPGGLVRVSGEGIKNAGKAGRIELISPRSIESQINAKAVTWLDRQMYLQVLWPPLKTPRFEGQYHRGPHWLLDKDPCDGPTRFLRFPTTL